MWYFTVRREDLSNQQYRQGQQLAELTEVETFGEPYPDFAVFAVENYRDFADWLDREGVRYELYRHRPERDQLLTSIR